MKNKDVCEFKIPKISFSHIKNKDGSEFKTENYVLSYLGLITIKEKMVVNWNESIKDLHSTFSLTITIKPR